MVANVSSAVAFEGEAAPVGRLQEIASLRTRGGQRFLPSAELQLAPTLRALAARLPGAAAGVLAVPELVGPAGLPDLVATPLSTGLHSRLGLPVPALLAEADARLVAACWPVRPLTVSALARRAQLPEPTLLRRLRRLEAVGAVLPTAGGWVRPAELTVGGRLYALEAKMTDWQAGIAQALRYSSWADAAAVVMHRLPRNHRAALDQARTLGVGLAEGDRWLVRPRIHRLTAARRLWASEHLVAALRGEQLSSAFGSQNPSAIA